MPTVSPSYPADDTTADVADYNVIIQAILAVFNGHIDGDNIEPGSLPWSVMDTFTNSIPSAAMEDDGNLVKYRDEANLAHIVSGLIWSQASGLNGNMTSGTQYSPSGKRNAIVAVTNHAFTASKDTYVTLSPAGSLSYQEVTVGNAPPALTTDYMPVALVTTDGSGITAVHDMAKRDPSSLTLARIELGLAGDTIQLGNIPAKKNLRIRIAAITSGQTNLIIQFNGDTGSNYYRQSSNDFGSGADSGPDASISISSAAATEDRYLTLEIMNILAKSKLMYIRIVENVASAAPDERSTVGKWVNSTEQITSLKITNSGTGDLAAGTFVVVEGND